MKPLTALTIALVLLFFSCASTQPIKPVDSPPKDCVIYSPHDGLPVVIEQGFFNDPDMFMTPEELRLEYEEWVKRQGGM